MTIPVSIAVGGHAADAEFVDAQNAINAILSLLSGQPSSGSGTATQVLHGGAAGFAAVGLTADVSGTLPVANGGTGSATQNFVDLTTGQTVGGAKVFTAVPVLSKTSQATLDWEDLSGAATKKRGRIVFDGGVNLTVPGWVFQDVDDSSGFVANLVVISRAATTAAASVGIGTVAPNTTLDVRGGLALGVVSKTANYGAGSTDYLILCNATGGAFTITLPAATKTGQSLAIVKTDASINAVTVARAGADTIEGVTTKALALQYDKITLVADGTSVWYDLGKGLI